MKNYFGLLIVLSFLFTSCKKEMEEVLPGTWNFTESISADQSASAMGVSVNQSATIASYSGTITFNEDGSGSFTTGGSTKNLTWTGDGKEKVKITVGSQVTNYSVVTNKKKEQEWEASVNGQSVNVNTSGVNTSASQSYKVKMKLTK